MPASSKPAGLSTLIALAPVPILIIYVETMIIPALPVVARDFGVPLAETSWVITIFLLIGGATSPIIGRLGDIHGKKRVLATVMSVHAVSLVAAAFAPNLLALILLRGVQGTGFAMLPLVLGILRDSYEPKRMAVAQGVMSTMFGVGGSLGLFAGAWITQTYGWRTTYLSLVPVSVLLIVSVVVFVKPPLVRHRTRLDVLGSLLIVATILPLLYGILRLPDWGPFDVRTLGLAAAFVAAGVLFVARERTARAPLIDLKLLARRDLMVTNVVGLAVGYGMFTLFQSLPALVQSPAPGGFGGTVFQAGLVQLPSSLATLATGPLNGWIVARWGPKRPLLVGLAGMTLTFATLAAVPLGLAQIAAIMLIFGFAISLTLVSTINMILIATPQRHVGVSTAMNQTFRTVGGTTGPAVAAAYLAAFTFGTTGDPSARAFALIFATAAIVMFAGLLVATRLSDRKAPAEEVVAAPTSVEELAGTPP